MIKHIVFWKLKEEALGNTKQQNAQQLKQRLEALRGQVDGMKHLEVGINFNPNGFDLCLYSAFDSRQALEAYQSFPPHVEIKGFVAEITTDRAVADYEC